MRSKVLETFKNLESPAAFAGIAALQNELGLPRKEIADELNKDRTYSLHKPRRTRFKRLKFQPSAYFTDLAVDLGDFKSLSRYNSGMKYVLIGVELLSRKVFTAAVKSKKSPDMADAFAKIFKEMKYVPWAVFSDHGGEMKGKQVQDLFKRHGITHKLSNDPSVKSAPAERSLRNLKTRLYKYLDEFATNRWIDALPKLTKAINGSVNRTLGVAPNQVNMRNWKIFYNKLYAKTTPEKPKFAVGDLVRMQTFKEPLSKGYKANFSDEIFVIDEILPKNPVTYRLKDLRGKRRRGQFYSPELTKTVESTYRIEKILRRRVRDGIKQLFVSWRGFSNDHNQWINESDVI
jgi:hypothetical protein